MPGCSPLRVVSLIASATEIVAALGFEDHLVGRSHECDFPESVWQLPACSASQVDVRASGREIDRRVKLLVSQAVSVYRVDAELLSALRPDVIITQTQCEVCAVSLRDVERAVCEMVDSRPKLVVLEPNVLTDVWVDICRVAEALQAPQRGAELVKILQGRLQKIATATGKLEDRPTVACIEWIDPLMAAGNWVPELVEMAGGRNLFSQSGKHSSWMTWDDLIGADPDAIAVIPCGFDIARTRQEMRTIMRHPEWRDLKAVRNHCVFLTDGNQYFNRPGPRLVESAEILAEILHPGMFDFGHEGIGWVRL